MKQIPLWLTISLGCFLLGVAAVIYLVMPGEGIPDIPGEICISNKFPGKSVPIDDINSKTRSVFNSTEFFSEPSDELFKVFQEEKFEGNKFHNGKAFPDIAQPSEIYRFFWLRSFHNPVVIRIYRIGGEKYIVAKQTDGKAGYQMGNLVKSVSRKLTDSEWCEFINLLDKADFWSKNKLDLATLSNDGAMWDLEGARDGRYYASGEQSPVDGSFYDACLYLMKISGLNIDEHSPDFY